MEKCVPGRCFSCLDLLQGSLGEIPYQPAECFRISWRHINVVCLLEWKKKKKREKKCGKNWKLKNSWVFVTQTGKKEVFGCTEIYCACLPCVHDLQAARSVFRRQALTQKLTVDPPQRVWAKLISVIVTVVGLDQAIISPLTIILLAELFVFISLHPANAELYCVG